MSGVVSIGSAVAAIGIAAVTSFETFAVIAAVGATVGAIGAVTHVKELQIAGAAVGAVGLVGGLANAAGLFGEAGVFGSLSGSGLGATAAGTTAAETASPFASAASGIDAGTWAGVAAAPTLGYEGPSSVGALMEGQGIVAGEIPGFDAIDMANGIPQVNTGTPEVATAAAPNVTPAPAEQVLADTQALPAYESPTKGFGLAEPAPGPGVEPPPGTLAPDISGNVPDPARTLLDNAPIDGDVPRDAFGNVISQGGGRGETVPGDLGAGARNPAAPSSEGMNSPTPAAATPGAPAPAPDAVTGETGLISNAPKGPYSATLAPDSAVPKMSLINGVNKVPNTPLEGPSMWDSLWQFTQKNQMLSYGAMQAMGSFLSGTFSPLPQAQVDAWKAQADQNHAAARLYEKQQELLQQRITNMNSPMPVAVRRPQGLINGGVPAVTGRIG